MHLVITDSGLGGLSICAGIARSCAGTDTRITYVNAWPEPGRGYNDLPDMAARAETFDRALRSFLRFSPDEIVIACNTLSIVYAHTAFRKSAALLVRGIIEAGVELFVDALSADRSGSLLLLGTRTTIESGVHRQRLLARGVPGERVASLACHGLAAAIERDPESATTAALIESCSSRAAGIGTPGEPCYAGLCCTHYPFVADRICSSLAHALGRQVLPLDPNARMVRDVVSSVSAAAPAGRVSVDVVSKVSLEFSSRRAMAALVEPVSPDAAAALIHYRHVPDLF